MRLFKAAALAFATLAVTVKAQADAGAEADLDMDAIAPRIESEVDFLDTSKSVAGEPILINGRVQTVNIKINSVDDEDMDVGMIGGQLIHPRDGAILWNVSDTISSSTRDMATNICVSDNGRRIQTPGSCWSQRCLQVRDDTQFLP